MCMQIHTNLSSQETFAQPAIAGNNCGRHPLSAWAGRTLSRPAPENADSRPKTAASQTGNTVRPLAWTTEGSGV